MEKELENLLVKLNDAYKKSEIKDKCPKNRKWGYELLITSLKENQPLLIGFNWGVDNTWEEYQKGRAYKNQEKIVKKTIDYNKGAIQRLKNSCKTYFPHISIKEASLSNFCFFRSEKENQISKHDVQLCIPIFEELIDIVRPSVIICFSSQARNWMADNKNKFMKKIKWKDIEGSKSYKIVIGLTNNNVPVYCLPHPSAHLKKEIRQKAWEYAKEHNPLVD